MANTSKAKGKARAGKFQASGQWIRTDARLAIYLRDRFTCLSCCRDLHDADPTDITLDHIVPRSSGGGNEPANLFTSCRSCNCSRQDKPLSRVLGPEARAHVRRNARRALKPYRTLAKAILSGAIDRAAALTEVR